jgi:hypothetical protein
VDADKVRLLFWDELSACVDGSVRLLPLRGQG